MSLKRNILSNYVSQIYVTVIGIFMVPMYVRYMGTEAYGLVGFFAMLQAWFQLLDMGLTPTMARATARFNGGASDALSLRRLLRALEGIFAGVAILGAAGMMAGSSYLADSWLRVEHLPQSEVQNAIILIALIVALRWVSGLYRGAINGLERLVWLSGFNIAVATARFLLVIPFFILVGANPTQFFTYQLALAVCELLVLSVQTYRLLPKVDVSHRLFWESAPLRGVLTFSLTIAFTSSVWVLVTQTDKLILSKLLTLSDYAYFTLAVLVSNGVTFISGPISGALLPRLSKLSASGDDYGLIKLYRDATQLICVIAVPTALVLAFFPEQVLWAWTGDLNIAIKVAPVLTLYALGNGVLALSAFPYYLQFAKGDLKLHLIGNVLFVMLLIPGLIWSTIHYGVIGAGWSWLVANTVYFIFWVPRVHNRFIKGLHTKWLFNDIVIIAIYPAIVVSFVKYVIVWPQDRAQLVVAIATVSLISLLVTAAASSIIRGKVINLWHARFFKVNTYGNEQNET